MKVSDLFEKRSHVPAKVGPIPNFTASDVVFNILGDKATDDADKLEQPGGENQRFVGPTWGFDGGAMFSNMDAPPGSGGAIGLRNLDGKTPRDIAEAAHEAFHALLQLRNKNFENEKVVNRLAIRWLQDNLDGMFLHQAIEELLKSVRGYKSQSYKSTKRWLQDQEDDGF